MFSKCIECETPGQNCVPNLIMLEFPQLVAFAKKRQKFLGWSNQTLAEKSNLPVGTIGRVMAGEDGCKYSTMRAIILALFGGYAADFQCAKEREADTERLAALASQNTDLAAKNNELLDRMDKIDELHRNDIRTVKTEYQAQVDFLKNEVEFLREDVRAWHNR